MAAPSILTDEQWDSLKAASIKGLGDQELADAYGIDRNAIRQRRFRDPIWQAARGSIKAIVTKNVTNKANSKEDAKNMPVIAQKVANLVSENISRLGEQNRLLALQIASKGLKRADSANLDVENWQDVKALMDITAKAAGLDQAQAVQVNVLSSGPVDFLPAEF
jgi:hypothetical protein